MEIPGFKRWCRHLPDYSEKQVKKLYALLPTTSLLLTLLFLIIELVPRFILHKEFNLNNNNINGLNNIELFWWKIEPLLPIIAMIILLGFGPLIAQIGFRRRDLRFKIGAAAAYKKVVKYVLIGVGTVFAGEFNLVLQGITTLVKLDSISWPINPQTSYFGSSLLIRFIINLSQKGFISNNITIYIKVIATIQGTIGLAIVLIGFITAGKAVKTFGIDSATLTYVYFPEDSPVIQNDIYSVVRHPMYLAVHLVAFGSMILYFSIYSIIGFILTVISMRYHIYGQEEPELVERFGDEYIKYKEKVPAIFIKPKNWPKLFNFLFGNNNSSDNNNQ